MNLIKSLTTSILLTLFCLSAQAQRFNINYINSKLSNTDLTYLNQIGQFEAKFYNIVFNTTANDTLPIRINLYGKQADYIRMQISAMHTTFIDGFYSPESNQMFLYKSDRYMEIMIHESSHNMLENNLRNSPRWLDEGIATLFGYLVVRTDGIFYVKQYRYIKMVKDNIYRGTLSLQDYFRYPIDNWYDEEKRDYMYGVGYSLVYFFVKDDIENLQHILTLMQYGHNTTDAITIVFGSFDRFEKRFRDFYKPEVGYRL